MVYDKFELTGTDCTESSLGGKLSTVFKTTWNVMQSGFCIHLIT